MFLEQDRLYLDNIEGSVIILKKLFEGKKFLSTLESSPESNVEQVQTILQSFKKKVFVTSMKFERYILYGKILEWRVMVFDFQNF